MLLLRLRALFPSEPVVEGHWSAHPSLRFGSSGRPMELDASVSDSCLALLIVSSFNSQLSSSPPLHFLTHPSYLPSRRLALEYQGALHYSSTLKGTAALERRTHMDEEKRRACLAAGIRLVSVPHWWDGELATLKSLLEAEAALTAPSPSHQRTSSASTV